MLYTWRKYETVQNELKRGRITSKDISNSEGYHGY